MAENPTDTPVIVDMFHRRREILEDMNRDLWYRGLNDLFFFVKIDPPLPGDSNEIFIVFYIPNLITWDTASANLKRLIMKTIVPITFMNFQQCIDTSYCAIHIPEKDKGILGRDNPTGCLNGLRIATPHEGEALPITHIREVRLC